MTEDFRGTEEVTIIQQHIKYFSRDYVAIEMEILTFHSWK